MIDLKHHGAVTDVTGSCHELADGGTVLIPAFSIGRTQELLYEMEGLIHEFGQTTAAKPPVGATSVAKNILAQAS